MVDWPITINQDMEDGSYNEAPENIIRSFQPEFGPPMVRRASFGATLLMEYTTILTQAEYTALVQFWRRDCLEGELSFDRRHPRTRQPVTMMWASAPKIAGIVRGKLRASISLRMMPDDLT